MNKYYLLIYQILPIIFMMFLGYEQLILHFKYKRINYGSIYDKMIIFDYELNDNSMLFFDFLKVSSKHNEVYIYFDSPGGSLFQVEKIRKLISNHNGDVICIVKYAGSAAFALFQYCDTRYVIPDAILMQHEAYIEKKLTLSELDLFCESIDELISYSNNFFRDSAKRIGLNFDDFMFKIKKDWIITGGEAAVNFGVADEVINFIQ